MSLQTILLTVVGSAILNMVVSAVQNRFQHQEIGECAIAGLVGGIAGGICACLLAQIGVNV